MATRRWGKRVLFSTANAGMRRQLVKPGYRMELGDKAILRQQVHRFLSARPTRWEQLWSLANTKFTLWLLSTMLVGTVTWSYASLHDTFVGATRNRDLIKRLDVEISGRLEASIYLLDEAKYGISRIPQLWDRPTVFYFVAGSLDANNITYEEFAPRSFSSLLLEAQQLLPDDQRLPLREALFGYFDLKLQSEGGDKSRRWSGTPTERKRKFQEAMQALEDARRIINEKIWAARWRP